ncbi:transposase [Lactiplantibacillus garii]|uniref:Transposase n=1 Tax=Lactiplantibacillus garii TaxID=2306423 RepID=A0A3R8J8P0_9LACO|nr:transposase [Lactiplantibacillus garii]RRK11393.1 transposase [Lactiplantibacillus garii]
MLTPKMIHDDISTHHEQFLTILERNPWLIPTLTTLHVIPVAIAVHGLCKNRALSKQLKIEREKTKQLALQQVDKVATVAEKHQCHLPLPAKLKAHLHPND